MTTKTAPKKSTKPVVAKDTRELTARLGPIKKVTKTEKVSKTAVRVTLECGHKRVVSPRKALRCRRCRVGAPKLKVVKSKTLVAAKKSAKKPVAKKAATLKREPVSAPAVAPVPEKQSA